MEEQEILKISRQTLIPWKALSLDLILFSSLLLGISIMGSQGFKEKLTVLFEDPAFSGTLLLITAVFISIKILINNILKSCVDAGDQNHHFNIWNPLRLLFLIFILLPINNSPSALMKILIWALNIGAGT